MADPLESNRVHMTSDRSLVIRDLAPADVARYTCSGLGAEDHVQFALDVLPAAAPEGLATAGNASADSMAGWTRYESQYLTPVAAGYPRQVQRMEVDWDAWGPCDGCTGKRYRRAACRVRFVDGTRAACRYAYVPRYLLCSPGSNCTRVEKNAMIELHWVQLEKFKNKLDIKV